MALGKNHITAILTEIFKYVRIHPNFASRPVWLEKMFLCCFFLKAGRKYLTNRPEVLFQHPQPPPSPPPPPNCSFPPEKCWIWIHEIWETPCYTEKKNSGGGGGGGGENFRALSQVFSSCFLGKTTQEHHTSHITQVGSPSLGGFWQRVRRIRTIPTSDYQYSHSDL